MKTIECTTNALQKIIDGMNWIRSAYKAEINDHVLIKEIGGDRSITTYVLDKIYHGDTTIYLLEPVQTIQIDGETAILSTPDTTAKYMKESVYKSQNWIEDTDILPLILIDEKGSPVFKISVHGIEPGKITIYPDKITVITENLVTAMVHRKSFTATVHRKNFID